MGILTYAGTPLVAPDVSFRKHEARWVDLFAPELWKWPAFQMEGTQHLPIPDHPKVVRPRFNVLYWPVGASRWPVMYTLADDAGAAAIVAAVGTASPLPKELVVSDDTNPLTTPMFLVNVRPLLSADGASDPGLAGNSKGRRLFVLTLVGQPYFWWGGNFFGQYTGAIQGDTWTTFLTRLVETVSTSNTGSPPFFLTPTIPSIPSAYAGGPNIYRWGGARVRNVPGPLLIDAAAATLGMRFVYDPDGTCRFVTVSQALTDDQARWDAYGNSTLVNSRVAWGGRSSVASQASNVPSSVTVGFEPQLLESLDNNVNVTLASLAISQYSGINGTAETTGWVFGDLTTDFRSGHTSWFTLQSNYATQAAKDYYIGLLSLTNCVFRGVLPIVASPRAVTGTEDRVEWEYFPGAHAAVTEDADESRSATLAEGRVVTRVVRRDLGENNLWGRIPDAPTRWCGVYGTVGAGSNVGGGDGIPIVGNVSPLPVGISPNPTEFVGGSVTALPEFPVMVHADGKFRATINIPSSINLNTTAVNGNIYAALIETDDSGTVIYIEWPRVVAFFQSVPLGSAHSFTGSVSNGSAIYGTGTTGGTVNIEGSLHQNHGSGFGTRVYWAVGWYLSFSADSGSRITAEYYRLNTEVVDFSTCVPLNPASLGVAPVAGFGGAIFGDIPFGG